MITAKRLKLVLAYNKRTGLFRWRIYKGAFAKVGKIAGSLNDKGYVTIYVDGKSYKAARLAWFYVKGVWPKYQIDHKNGKRADNRFSNLRDATPSQNSANARIRKGFNNPYKGVSFFKQSRKWRVQININSRPTHVGYFDDPKVAHAAYVKAAKKQFGEFACAG